MSDQIALILVLEQYSGDLTLIHEGAWWGAHICWTPVEDREQAALLRNACVTRERQAHFDEYGERLQCVAHRAPTRDSASASSAAFTIRKCSTHDGACHYLSRLGGAARRIESGAVYSKT